MELGMIGYGNMGSAIIKGLVHQGCLKAEQIGVYDPGEEAAKQAKALGLKVFSSLEDLVLDCPVLMLAVKPNRAGEILRNIRKEEGLLVSLVAGLDTKTMKKETRGRLRVLRIMPNTPAMVGEGFFALSLDTDAREEERERLWGWLNLLGRAQWVEEKLFGAVTGLSGSGPAFGALFIEAMADAGVHQGLSRELALSMAAQTLLGTARQMLDTGIKPAAIKDMVCSPGGTTIAGVYALEQRGFRCAVMEAVVSASQRAASMEEAGAKE